jgi:hypothetical protein
MMRFTRRQNIWIGFLGGFLVLANAGCVGDSEEKRSRTTEPAPNFVRCTEPRPQACTMIYLPVCATSRDGTMRTYASDCVACSDPDVVGYRPDPCE